MKSPDISVSVAGQDCSGDVNWTPEKLRIIATAFERASEAIEKKEHGAIDVPDLAHIGIDFGGDFDEDGGLPSLEVRCGYAKGGGGRTCGLPLGHELRGPNKRHAFQCGS